MAESPIEPVFRFFEIIQEPAYRLEDFEPSRERLGDRVVSRELPPGGGACFWCSGRLYQRGGEWHYRLIEEQGHPRAVHLDQCGGPRPDYPEDWRA